MESEQHQAESIAENPEVVEKHRARKAELEVLARELASVAQRHEERVGRLERLKREWRGGIEPTGWRSTLEATWARDA